MSHHECTLANYVDEVVICDQPINLLPEVADGETCLNQMIEDLFDLDEAWFKAKVAELFESRRAEL